MPSTMLTTPSYLLALLWHAVTLCSPTGTHITHVHVFVDIGKAGKGTPSKVPNYICWDTIQERVATNCYSSHTDNNTYGMLWTLPVW